MNICSEDKRVYRKHDLNLETLNLQTLNLQTLKGFGTLRL